MQRDKRLVESRCKLTKQQFLDLVDSPMNREAYEKILAGQGLV